MYDLIIKGGGLSGASAGRRAGKLGLNTLLLEKEEFPRYKPCGRGPSEHAISYLYLEPPPKISEWEITEAKFFFKEQFIKANKKHRLFVLIFRNEFGNFLLDKAKEMGIEVHTKEKVLCCEEMPTYVEVKTKKTVYHAKFAVVAEGIQRVVKKCVRPADIRGEYGMRVVTEVPAKEKEIKERLGNNLQLYFGIAGCGYVWIFPRKTYYSVGIDGIAKDFPHPKKHVFDLLRKNGFFGKYEIHGHKISRCEVERRITSSRILLVRVTARFVDAFSGEGSAYAIISGQFASEVIAGICLCWGNLKDLAIYKSLCKKECRTHLKYSLIFPKIMHSFPDQAFKVFASNEKMANKHLYIVDFRPNYKDYLRRCLINFKLM